MDNNNKIDTKYRKRNPSWPGLSYGPKNRNGIWSVARCNFCNKFVSVGKEKIKQFCCYHCGTNLMSSSWNKSFSPWKSSSTTINT